MSNVEYTYTTVGDVVEDNPWIEWDGEKYSPDLPEGTEVEVTLRGGDTSISKASHFRWRWDDSDDDIIKYRVISKDPVEANSSTEKQSLRYNEGKPELSYILDVMPALKDMVEVMEFGAIKYERNNWKKGFPKDKLLDSLLRHIDAFYSGEDIDPDSGKLHVGHIMCNAAFLAYHYGSFKGGKATNE